jgi:hypothetical protein
MWGAGHGSTTGEKSFGVNGFGRVAVGGSFDNIGSRYRYPSRGLLFQDDAVAKVPVVQNLGGIILRSDPDYIADATKGGDQLGEGLEDIGSVGDVQGAGGAHKIILKVE